MRNGLFGRITVGDYLGSYRTIVVVILLAQVDDLARASSSPETHKETNQVGTDSLREKDAPVDLPSSPHLISKSRYYD